MFYMSDMCINKVRAELSICMNYHTKFTRTSLFRQLNTSSVQPNVIMLAATFIRDII